VVAVMVEELVEGARVAVERAVVPGVVKVAETVVVMVEVAKVEAMEVAETVVVTEGAETEGVMSVVGQAAVKGAQG
jgi:hypothetical protein